VATQAGVEAICSVDGTDYEQDPHIVVPPPEERVCLPSTCAPVPEVPGAQVTYSGFLLNSVATVTCSFNYMSNVTDRIPVAFSITCAPLTNVLPSREAAFKDDAGNKVWGGCVPTVCDEPFGPHGAFVAIKGLTGQGQAWELQCNEGYFVSGGSSIVRCAQNGVVHQHVSCALGGCETDQLVIPPNAVGITCPASVAEKTKCTARCKAGYVASGEWTCSMTEFVGSSVCAVDTTVLVNMSGLSGSFGISLVPLGLAPLANPTTEFFRETLLSATAWALNVDESSFALFEIVSTRRLQTVGDGVVSGFLEPRQLSDNIRYWPGLFVTKLEEHARRFRDIVAAAAGFPSQTRGRHLQSSSQKVSATITYELFVQDAARMNAVKNILQRFSTLDDTAEVEVFKNRLAQSDFGLVDLTVLLAPRPFTTLVAQKTENTSTTESSSSLGPVFLVIVFCILGVVFCCCCFVCFFRQRVKGS